jgi:hypothetical protein
MLGWLVRVLIDSERVVVVALARARAPEHVAAAGGHRPL